MCKFGLISILMSLILFGCGSSDPIAGEWERYGDKYEGMRVKLVKNDNGYIGKISFKPEKIPFFEKGDVKWKDFTFIKTNHYEYNELYKKKNKQGIIESFYRKHHMQITFDNEMELTAIKDESNSEGTFQHFRRLR